MGSSSSKSKSPKKASKPPASAPKSVSKASVPPPVAPTTSDPNGSMTIKVGCTVSTIYGTGKVIACDPSKVTVRLTSWVLAYDSKVTCYLDPAHVELEASETGSYDNCSLPPTPPIMVDAPMAIANAFSPIGSFNSGDRVQTPFGVGVVTDKRPGDYVVMLDKEVWELAYGQRPTLYLAPHMLKRLSSPAPIVGGERCVTQFGSGYVLSTKPDGMLVVESDKWQLAYSSTPILHLQRSMVSRPTSKVASGTKCRTPFGVGYVMSTHPSNGQMIVEPAPETWELAYKQKPRMFLDPSTVTDFEDSAITSGSTVSTPYGPAVVLSVMSDAVICEPVSWSLAYGQKPKYYLQHDQVSRFDPKAFRPSQIVDTQYGPCAVLSKRRDCFVCEPVTWELAYGQIPRYYLQEDTIRGVFDERTLRPGKTVDTQYGLCVISSLRGDCVVAQPLEWTLAYGQVPTFFLQKESVSKAEYDPNDARTGCSVDTPYGKCVVTSIRKDCLVLEPKTWSLAYGQIPTFYLQKDTVKVTK